MHDSRGCSFFVLHKSSLSLSSFVRSLCFFVVVVVVVWDFKSHCVYVYVCECVYREKSRSRERESALNITQSHASDFSSLSLQSFSHTKRFCSLYTTREIVFLSLSLCRLYLPCCRKARGPLTLLERRCKSCANPQLVDAKEKRERALHMAPLSLSFDNYSLYSN